MQTIGGYASSRRSDSFIWALADTVRGRNPSLCFEHRLMLLQVALHCRDEFETTSPKLLLGNTALRLKHAELNQMHADSVDAQLLLCHRPSLAFAELERSGHC